MTPNPRDPLFIRRADKHDLAAALSDARSTLLRLFDAWRACLPPSLEIPYAAELNPPRWELGHIAWFEERWLARNPERLRGARADPDAARAAPLLRGADALYDSSRVAHDTRWHLDLPDAARTLDLMRRVRERTLKLLDASAPDDDALYFFRLVLLHEDMHAEAWITMAQRLGLDIHAALTADRPAPVSAHGDWTLPGARVTVGAIEAGFAFDNELGVHEIELAPFGIARAPVTWDAYLPFIEAGAYDDERLWSADGWAWRQAHSPGLPRHLVRNDDGRWRQTSFGRLIDLDRDAPAMHITAHEAAAWCRWAGRRLPTEAEWEHAARSAAAGTEAFEWGQVWEWTASPFAPYPGFEPHPYRDYSMPFFDGRPVLRGGSFASSPRIKHPAYRNYFGAERSDLFAGFRSCAG